MGIVGQSVGLLSNDHDLSFTAARPLTHYRNARPHIITVRKLGVSNIAGVTRVAIANGMAFPNASVDDPRAHVR
jgi:hypothetical protein